ncbi:class I SAM-dependent methyltransferase [Pseudonocardia adelaidensis]|uniref:class I SAM-dependent methyltransferase n=1 Tax=Pseudonocardia adelaidensis TaxID=648754 RepID=UPI0031E72288
MTSTVVRIDPSNARRLQAWDGAEGDYWAANAHAFERALGGYDAAFFAAAAIRPGDQVLDVGCGTGSTTREAARRAEHGSATGIDLSGAMIMARARSATAALTSPLPGTYANTPPLALLMPFAAARSSTASSSSTARPCSGGGRRTAGSASRSATPLRSMAAAVRTRSTCSTTCSTAACSSARSSGPVGSSGRASAGTQAGCGIAPSSAERRHPNR